MIDTNTVSYIIRGRSPAARARLAGLAKNEIACISAITEAELRFGVAKNPNAHRLLAAVEKFLARIEVLEWGRAEAATYGSLRATQEAAGKPLGVLDMLIAAHALSVEAVIVTSDRAFQHVANLQTVNWADDI